MIKSNWILFSALAAATIGVSLLSVRKKKKQQADREILRQGLIRLASRFDGLYEALYQSVTREFSPDPYQEWQERLHHIGGGEPFMTLWEQAFPKDAPPEEASQKLLALVREAGFTRLGETVHTVGPDTWSKYHWLGQPLPAAGTACRVMKAGWMRDSQVVEKGLLIGEDNEYGL